MTLKLEIVTPVFNRRDETLRCLRSIYKSDLKGLSVHVIIVDDGSTDGTGVAVRNEFPDVEIINGDGNLWYTAGTNRGFTAALRYDPDYILAINNDQTFDERCIRNMVECAESHPKSVIGAVLLDREAPEKVFQVAPRWEFWKGGYRHWTQQTVATLPSRPWKVDCIVGNCVLYPLAAIREVGLMNEKLVQYGDAEYTPRMRRRGWTLLIDPDARVFCKPNDQISGFRKMPLSKQIHAIFRNPSGPYSLQRRFYSTVGGAPNVIVGTLAVGIFYLRVLLGISQESSWAISQPEPPLSETFAAAMVDD